MDPRPRSARRHNTRRGGNPVPRHPEVGATPPTAPDLREPHPRRHKSRRGRSPDLRHPMGAMAFPAKTIAPMGRSYTTHITHQCAHKKTARHNRAVRYCADPNPQPKSEEHTSELQSLMRISYAVFCLKKKNK